MPLVGQALPLGDGMHGSHAVPASQAVHGRNGGNGTGENLDDGQLAR